MADTLSISDSLQVDQPARSHAASRSVRVWPVVVLLVAFWAFMYVHYHVEMAMQTRFFSRMIVHGILLIGFLVWWFTQRAIPWRDRWLAVAMLGAGTLFASFVADPTLDLFAFVLSSLPIVLTSWAAWVILSRNLSPAAQRVGFCIALALSLGYFDLLRWDGLTSNQQGQFSWRWTPSAESLFLASRQSAAPQDQAATTAWSAKPGDWLELRGAGCAGIIADVRLATDWKDRPPRLVWRQRVGPSWSSMIVVDGHVVTQEQRGENEAIVSYAAADGKEEWVHEDKARFYEGLSGPGPRATPTFQNGRIYAFGATGILTCLDAASGKPLWRHDLVAENGAAPPLWGFSSSPLVTDGLVIAYAGGPGDKDLVAYEADSGKPVWERAAGAESYSTPQVVTIGSQRQLVMQSNEATSGYNIADGELLWTHANGASMTLPMLQPYTVGDNRLIVTAGQGLALIEVSQTDGTWSTNDVWISDDLQPSFNSFVTFQEHLYGLGDGILRCLSLQTGKLKWKKGRFQSGQVMLVADQGLLLALGEQGAITLFEANPEKAKEVASFQAIDGKTWNHPVIAHGRLYVRNGEEMACYELPGPDGPAGADK